MLSTLLIFIFCLFVFRSDKCGQFMASASAQGLVFIYSSRPSSNFAVVGYIGMSIYNIMYTYTL